MKYLVFLFLSLSVFAAEDFSKIDAKCADGPSCFKLSTSLMGKGDQKQAMGALHQSCKYKSPVGCMQLGIQYLNTYSDKKKATNFLMSACDLKNQIACVLLGSMYWEKNANDERAKRLFKIACDNSFGVGCYYLGLYYTSTNDVKQFRPLFEKGCKLNNAESCLSLAEYLVGEGEETAKEGLRFARMGCESLSNGDNCFLVAEVTEAILEKPKEALGWYDKACTFGHFKACNIAKRRRKK